MTSESFATERVIRKHSLSTVGVVGKLDTSGVGNVSVLLFGELWQS